MVGNQEVSTNAGVFHASPTWTLTLASKRGLEFLENSQGESSWPKPLTIVAFTRNALAQFPLEKNTAAKPAQMLLRAAALTNRAPAPIHSARVQWRLRRLVI